MEITELRQKVQEGEILQQGASTPKFSRKAVTNSANHNVDHKPARARAGVCSGMCMFCGVVSCTQAKMEYMQQQT